MHLNDLINKWTFKRTKIRSNKNEKQQTNKQTNKQ